MCEADRQETNTAPPLWFCHHQIKQIIPVTNWTGNGTFFYFSPIFDTDTIPYYTYIPNIFFFISLPITLPPYTHCFRHKTWKVPVNWWASESESLLDNSLSPCFQRSSLPSALPLLDNEHLPLCNDLPHDDYQ